MPDRPRIVIEAETCQTCDGVGGWNGPDGTWTICALGCHGNGWTWPEWVLDAIKYYGDGDTLNILHAAQPKEATDA